MVAFEGTEHHGLHRAVHLRQRVHDHRAHATHSGSQPGLHALGVERRRGDVRHVEPGQDLLGGTDLHAGLAAAGGPTDQREAEGADHAVDAGAAKPLANHHMGLHPGHEAGQHLDPLCLQLAHYRRAVCFALEQVLAEAEQGDPRPPGLALPSRLGPALEVVEVAEPLGRIGMEEAHGGDLAHGVDLGDRVREQVL